MKAKAEMKNKRAWKRKENIKKGNKRTCVHTRMKL